jgi:hypothetical protein
MVGATCVENLFPNSKIALGLKMVTPVDILINNGLNLSGTKGYSRHHFGHMLLPECPKCAAVKCGGQVPSQLLHPP